MNAVHQKLVAGTMLICVVAVSSASCALKSEGAPSERAGAGIDVRAVPASIQNIQRSFEAGGTIRSSMTANLASRMVAEIREVRVHPGDLVKRGQVLIVLDGRELAAGRMGAEASLVAARQAEVSAQADLESATAHQTLAREMFERTQSLRDKNSATPQELDGATAELAAAEAGVRGAAARVAAAHAAMEAADASRTATNVAFSYTVISAPFDGVVTSTKADAGNMTAPGASLLVLEQVNSFRLEAQVDESRARLVKVGAQVAVDLRNEGEMLMGRVTEVPQSSDPVAHAFVVKVGLPPGAPVRSGMFARALFPGEQRAALVVPAASLVRRGQLTLVFVIDPERRARMRAINPGVPSADLVEVLSGVGAGEEVVVNPGPSMADGALVHVVGGRP